MTDFFAKGGPRDTPIYRRGLRFTLTKTWAFMSITNSAVYEFPLKQSSFMPTSTITSDVLQIPLDYRSLSALTPKAIHL
jgi:hypothetical protein